MESYIKQGDCLDLMREIPDKSIDMILCDLPYGTTANKWDSVLPFAPMWENYERTIKDNGAIVLFAQCPFDKMLGMSNKKMLRYEWIWQKPQGTNFLSAKKMPLKKHENILVFYKKSPTYNPQMMAGKPYTRGKSSHYSTNYGQYVATGSENHGTRYPTTVLNFKKDKERLHPTQKPVPLLEYLVKTYTNAGEIVLDNCMGVGSTPIACVNTDRRYIGFELDQDYFDIAKNRIGEAERTRGGGEKYCLKN